MPIIAAQLRAFEGAGRQPCRVRGDTRTRISSYDGSQLPCTDMLEFRATRLAEIAK
jgi:hypothetical protein